MPNTVKPTDWRFLPTGISQYLWITLWVIDQIDSRNCIIKTLSPTLVMSTNNVYQNCIPYIVAGTNIVFHHWIDDDHYNDLAPSPWLFERNLSNAVDTSLSWTAITESTSKNMHDRNWSDPIFKIQSAQLGISEHIKRLNQSNIPAGYRLVQ